MDVLVCTVNGCWVTLTSGRRLVVAFPSRRFSGLILFFKGRRAILCRAGLAKSFCSFKRRLIFLLVFQSLLMCDLTGDELLLTHLFGGLLRNCLQLL